MLTFGYKDEKLEYEIRKTAYAVIFDKKGLLGIIRVGQNYFLLGGGIERGETEVECLRRESLEEIGYSLRQIVYLGQARQYFLTRKGNPQQNEATFYLAKLEKKVKAPVESDHALQWFDTEKEWPHFFHDHQRWAAEQALNLLR
ncbi:MAG: NUDIX domain-containing protein [Sporolactobacillus sp.]